MRKALLISLSFLMISIIFNGCSTVHLHPVDEQDIRDGGDGWVCMSQDYIKNVMKVKLDQK